MPGWALKVCADQLAKVFTYIFNLSMSQFGVPSPFKASTMDCSSSSGVLFKQLPPYGTDSVIMMCFEQLVKTQYLLFTF